jgi:hypothetical protein
MIQFIYDFCLLYKITENETLFDVVEMQTDDILLLIDQSFVALKKETIKSAKIMIKNQERLTSDNFLKFNEIRIERLDSNEIIFFRQETHIQGIQLIQSIESSSITSARGKVRINLSLREQYIAQRARDVYLAVICQFETTFDLSHAAQSIESTFSSDDIITLNKRLK